MNYWGVVLCFAWFSPILISVTTLSKFFEYFRDSFLVKILFETFLERYTSIILFYFICFLLFVNDFFSVFTTAHSPPLMTKQPTNGESLFQVSAKTNNENEKPFIIECEAEGEPAPT